MKELFYRLKQEQETEMWEKAIFVFDSSSLLNFYKFSKNTREVIYSSILPALKDRLWIAQQTEFEFLKNRDRVLHNPEQLYKELKESNYPTKHFKSFKNQYNQLKARTSKDISHPYIAPKVFQDFDNVLISLEEQLIKLESAMDLEIEKQLAEQADFIRTDRLLDFFKVTAEFTYKQLMEVAEEGEFRYKHKIPPGYADEKKKEELGLAKFGDLIIWKQLIYLAQKIRQPLILIIDDGKDDWLVDYRDDAGPAIAPRYELIKEMHDEGGVPFWLYNSSDFLFKAREILKFSITTGAIEEVQDVIERRADLIEEAVFKWAEKKYNVDETIKARDYWNKDTCADIIQQLDGVSFSINVKYFSGRLRFKDIHAELQQIKKVSNESFEINTLVIVTDFERSSIDLKILIEGQLPDFEIIPGIIDQDGNFVEVGGREKGES